MTDQEFDRQLMEMKLELIKIRIEFLQESTEISLKAIQRDLESIMSKEKK